jgi:D-alanine-D-alanine ligase
MALVQVGAHGTTWARVQVGLLFGGWGSEYELSCASAAAMLEALDLGRYEVFPIHLSRTGQWVTGTESLAEALRGRGPDELAAALAPPADVTLAAGFREAANLLRSVDVVLPAMHGAYGEDGTLQSMLDGIGVPYVGSGVFASAAGRNRVVTKRLAAASGVPVAAGVVLRPGESDLGRAQRAELRLPLVVKPAQSGTDRGVSRVNEWTEVPDALAAARAHDSVVLVEEAIVGRTVTLSVLEQPDGRLVAGPPLEFRAGDERPFLHVDAGVHQRLKELALTTFQALGCAGLMRADFVLRDGSTPVLSEVNTRPAMVADASFARAWAAAGLAYPRLLDLLIETALRRPLQRRGRRRLPSQPVAAAAEPEHALPA